MSDHIGDANKMISETPRMRAAQQAAMEHMTGDVWRVGCDIERELNAANNHIKRLEIAGDAMAKRFVWDLPVNVDWRKAKEEA